MRYMFLNFFLLTLFATLALRFMFSRNMPNEVDILRFPQNICIQVYSSVITEVRMMFAQYLKWGLCLLRISEAKLTQNIRSEAYVCSEYQKWGLCLLRISDVRLMLAHNIRSRVHVCSEYQTWGLCLLRIPEVRLMFAQNMRSEAYVCSEYEGWGWCLLRISEVRVMF
jgi:hypothetical protein